MKQFGIAVVALVAAAGAVQAQAIDGVLTGGDGYGAPVFIQGVQTGFGPAPNGSELGAIYCKSDATHLTLFFAGSLERNFNKLNVFFDTKSGGQNTLTSSNPTNDGWASKYNGFTFDTGFNADYMMIFRRGFDDSVAPFGSDVFDVDFAEIGGSNGGRLGRALTVTPNGTLLNNPIGSLPAFAAVVGYTNSSTSIGGGNGSAVNPADALALTGGIELRLPLSSLGLSAGQTFLLSAHITNGDHNYLSNQFAGSLPTGQANLGSDGTGAFFGEGPGPRGVNLNQWVGNQYVLIPAPGAMSLLALGGLLVGRRRRA